SMNAMWLLLGDGLLFIFINLTDIIILFSFLLDMEFKAYSGDVHCVDWNPLDFLI
ncbi:hypothetical protein ACJX0J_023522, partial [Zea mays]